MIDQVTIWALRILWVALPFTLGTALTDAVGDYSDRFSLVVQVLFWAIWGAGMIATAVPHTVTITYLRIVAPLAVAVAVWSMTGDSSTVLQGAAVVVAALAAVVVFSQPIGARWINGTSYGDERRLPLRSPRRLWYGPIPLTWLVVVAGALAGPLLLGAGQWLAGVAAVIAGFGAANFGWRALFGLAKRWLVFVPAGVVVHDFTSLADPQLFRRVDISHIGPALADTEATDLTLAAAGLAVEVAFVGPTKIVRRPKSPKEAPEELEANAVLVMPSQPGVVLTEAKRRRLPVA